MYPRTISQTLTTAVRTFPAVVLTGPRQSGKTTTLKQQFGSSHQYTNLENPDVRLRAKSDPVAFLNQFSGSVILDEIQYVPELLPYIKSAIDRHRQPGTWLLTGSQNFSLMQGVTESLAGRAAVISLLPFSISENLKQGTSTLSVEQLLSTKNLSLSVSDQPNLTQILLRGQYPEIASNPQVDRQLWCGSYITTYLERDIRNLQQVGDLGQYELFLRACAARTGQILDLTGIARDIGISITTAKRWLSLLETGYQILLLRPYYKNINKQLVKRPKLYFTDTGLASYLLGIHSSEPLVSSPQFGSLFETLIVTDFWKRFHHHGQKPSMYFLRTRDDLEIDLVIELNNKLYLIEIKSTSTIKPEHGTSLTRATRDLGSLVAGSIIISNSPDSFPLTHNIYNHSWKRFLSI